MASGIGRVVMVSAQTYNHVVKRGNNLILKGRGRPVMPEMMCHFDAEMATCGVSHSADYQADCLQSSRQHQKVAQRHCEAAIKEMA